MKKSVIFALVTVLSLPVFAGRMKDLLIDHEEAVLKYLFGSVTASEVSFKNPRFVDAQFGDIAISSEVESLDVHSFEFVEQTCTTEFVEMANSHYSPLKVYCN